MVPTSLLTVGTPSTRSGLPPLRFRDAGPEFSLLLVFEVVAVVDSVWRLMVGLEVAGNSMGIPLRMSACVAVSWFAIIRFDLREEFGMEVGHLSAPSFRMRKTTQVM